MKPIRTLLMLLVFGVEQRAYDGNKVSQGCPASLQLRETPDCTSAAASLTDQMPLVNILFE